MKTGKKKTAGGDGEKKKVGETASTRWGQEWLSIKDWGHHPNKTRSPGDREQSDFDDNTTSVGQPGDRQNLGGSQRWDTEVSSGGRIEERPKEKSKK